MQVVHFGTLSTIRQTYLSYTGSTVTKLETCHKLTKANMAIESVWRILRYL